MADGFPPPVARTIAWLRGRFGDWYRQNPPPMPDRHPRREFGFILWPERPGPPPFVRHKAFPNAGGLHEYLARGPHSAYYSTAYYRRPGEPRMQDKQWLGAELIFDLDADHLDTVEAAKKRGEEVPIAAQLDQVRRQFIHLLDDFLLGDLGLSEKDLWITFSGGRGYHCHVVEPAYMQLDAKARREIVDYVTGKVPTEKGTDQPDLEIWIERKVVGMKGRGDWAKPIVQERIAPVTTPGWPGRITRTLVHTLRTEVMERPAEEAEFWLTGLSGVGEKSARDFRERLDEAMLERISNGVLEQGAIVKKVCHHMMRQTTIPLAKGETDEPVTADVKRLIRLPGSLHGKSGLKVVTLKRDELDSFDPLRDAVAFPLDGSVKIMPRRPQSVELAGETVRVEEGVETDVPIAHAVWICSRQGGSVVV